MRLCDSGLSNFVNTSIPLLVVAVNQPPKVHFPFNVSTFSSALDGLTAVPSLSVSDIDHSPKRRSSDLLTSFGLINEAPISVTIHTQVGRVTLLVKEGVTLPQGKGELDRAVTMRGPIDKVNQALATLSYICRTMDGCVANLRDTLTVKVDDEGFSGRGGSLSAEVTMGVTVI